MLIFSASGSYAGGYGWRIEKRNLSTGVVIWSQKSDSSQVEIAHGISIDGTGIYVTGLYNYYGGAASIKRIEKRELTSGNVIWFKTRNPFDILKVTNI